MLLKIIAVSVIGVSLTACSVSRAVSLPHQTEVLTNSPLLSNQISNQINYPADGKLIFILEDGKGKHRTSYLIQSRADGSESHILTQTQGSFFALSASQDGKTLLFTEQQQSYPAIFKFDIATGKKNLLTPQRANHFSASFSPNQQAILLASSMNDNPEIFLAKSDGTVLEQLTDDPAVDIAPQWLADRQGFIFTSDRNGVYHPQLYHYDFDNKKTTLLTHQGSYNASPKVSRDGKLLTYLQKDAKGAIVQILTTLNDLTVNTPLCGRCALQNSDKDALEPVIQTVNFSSDGQWLIYSDGQAIYWANIAKFDSAQSLKSMTVIAPNARLTLTQIMSQLVKARLINLDKSNSADISISEPIFIN